jgi:hypothetical protein
MPPSASLGSTRARVVRRQWQTIWHGGGEREEGSGLSNPLLAALLQKMHPAEGDERVSLAGFDPEEALRALLKVDPDAPPVEPDDQDGQERPRKGSQ